jgi:hypothetical protein
LTAVEGPALVFIAEDFIGSIDFGKARGHRGIGLDFVRMQLADKPQERGRELRGACASRHPKHIVGVTHPNDLTSVVIEAT